MTGCRAIHGPDPCLWVTRDGWVGTATASGAAIVEVEVVCSDADEHRRRVETRSTDVEGLVKPTWAEVIGREYEPWDGARVVVDTARTSVADAVDLVAAEVAAVSSSSGPARA